MSQPFNILFHHQMYDFTGDFETFFTGERDSRMAGLYDTFRGSTDLPHWDGKHCSNIQNASDGTKFKSFLEEDDELLFFRKSMCRPQRLVSFNEILVSYRLLKILVSYLHRFKCFNSNTKAGSSVKK